MVLISLSLISIGLFICAWNIKYIQPMVVFIGGICVDMTVVYKIFWMLYENSIAWNKGNNSSKFNALTYFL